MGKKRKINLWDVFNAILWIARTDVQWHNLDDRFPDWLAVYYYFDKLERIQSDRQPSPSLGVVDSQSVKLAPMIFEHRGTDGHKKVNGVGYKIQNPNQGYR